MSDYTNTPIGSGYNANSAINTELSAVETAVNSKLDKSGSTMTGELDMNSKKIINLPDATTLQEPVTYGQMINGASFAASDAKYFATVALATADTTLAVGDVVIIEERANGIFNVISGTGTANTYNIIAHGSLSLSLELRLNGEINVKQYGATGDGVTDDTGAFTAARTDSGGRYFIPDGNYILDASPDVWDDPFSSGYSVTLTVAGTPFTASRCLAGQLRVGATNDTITNINGARSGEIIFRISDGSASGQSHQSYLPWDIRRDSHSFIVSPETDGGTCDHLFRRSGGNTDSFGNRYAFNFTESSDNGVTPDLWSITYATSDNGSPSFDTFMACESGTSPTLKFPALPPLFEQGFSVKKRSTGVFEYQHKTNVNDSEIINATTATTLMTYDDDGVKVGRKKTYLSTVTDIQATSESHELSGNIALASSSTDTYRLVASGSICAGTLRLVATGSGATFGVRHIAFQSDGTTVTTQTIGVDNLAPQITANLVLNSGILDLEISYTSGIGGTVKGSFTIDWDVRTV